MVRSSEQSKLQEPRDSPEITLTNDQYKATLHKGRIELESLPSPQEQQQQQQKPSKSFKSGGRTPPTSSSSSSTHTFPEKGYAVADVTCMGLTQEFLVYGNKSGSIFYFYLHGQSPLPVTEYRHVDCGISRLWLNGCGSRLIFEDERHSVFIYNPLDDQVLIIPGFFGTLQTTLWDASDNRIFVLAESTENFVYLYSHMNIWCPYVTMLGASSRPLGFQPVALHNGILQCKLDSGETKNLILQTHQWKHKGAQGNTELKERFKESLALLQFKEAWNDALAIKSTEIWDRFTQKALEHLEVEIAIKSCQQSKNIKLIPYLNQIEQVENRALLAGHIFLLFGDHDAAQDAFLKSCSPEAALEMRSDLQQWDKALALAIELGSSSASEVKREYAQLLERQGEHRHALAHYEGLLKSGLNSKQLHAIRAGIARTSIHCGDPWKGKQNARQCDDSSLYNECAKISEGMSLLEDAAELYELGGQLEKAVLCYISVKNFLKACSILKVLASPKLYVEYAKALEIAENVADAASAFESAEDYENVVRLYLDPLQNPSKAYSVIRKTKSVSGAVLAAKFCKNSGDYERAIEFLILAKRPHEAKELAEQHDKMDVYTGLVVDVTSKDECLQLARYYETMGEYSKAGTLLERSGETDKALKLYLSLRSNSGIEQAIELVGRERSEMLTSQLFDHLNQEQQTSLPYLYMLHKVLGNYQEAAGLVAILATEEQEKGNYKKAHQLLLDFCLVLQHQGQVAPSKILNQLMLLHSYVLVKVHIRLGDHSTGSQLLIRVARNISKFPSHVVPILTSTVIECDRAGLKTTAFEFASMLMHPDYRNLISPTYKRKVEKIVRKCEKVEEKEPATPCPICLALLPNMQLECENCNNSIPFCVASGRHMVLGDWTACPHCKFPALATEFLKVMKIDSLCPMCSKKVLPNELKCIDNPLVA